MEAFGRIAYFLVSRARVVALSLKKAADPRFVIAFSLTYPHIYARLSEVISTAQQTIQNVGSELESWIWGTYEQLYQTIRERIGWLPFGDQIAGIVAGMALAYPYLIMLVVKHFAVHVASLMLTITLNVLGAMYYIFCRVVIPAIQVAFGGYLFYKMLGPSMRYVARALDRFMQGNVRGFVGALAGALAPFAGFFVGPLAIGIVASQACQYAYVPPLVGDYVLPYFGYYQSTVSGIPVVSSVEPFTYVPGANQPPNVLYPAASYVYPYVLIDARQFRSPYGMSYIYPYVYIDIRQVLPSVSCVYPYIYVAAYPPISLYWGSYVYPYVYVATYPPIVSVSYVFPFPIVSVTFYTPYGYGVTYYITPYGSYSYTQGMHPYLSVVIPTVSVPIAQVTIYEILDAVGFRDVVAVYEVVDAVGFRDVVAVYEVVDAVGFRDVVAVYEVVDAVGFRDVVAVYEVVDAVGLRDVVAVYEVITALRYVY